MNYEELSLSGFINEIRDVSTGPHPRKFCFVLGAGASKTSGIKSGQELVNIWDRELQERNPKEHEKWKQQLGITDSNKYSFYSRYYERRFRRQPADGYNYLEKLMEHSNPSIGYVMLSHILSKTSHNVVITTNFDHLTEDAINYYAQTIPLIIGHETLTHYISRRIKRPTIIKIHRDLLFDPRNRTDELEMLHDNWKETLNSVFTEYHPIFIGYAGNDNSLMNFLIDNSEKFVDGQWAFPYWMQYKTDQPGERILEFLDKSNGYLIRHSGFDEVMYLLGAIFDFKLPSREEFLNDAEKRYQMLSNSIDEFTEKSARPKEISQEEGEPEENGQKERAKTAPDVSDMAQAVQQITNQTELQRLYREAVMLVSMGKFTEAIQLEQQLVRKSPGNARYHYTLGVTFHKMRNYEEALKEAKKAVDLEPDNAKYQNSLGVILHEMRRYQDAFQAKQRAIELEPDNRHYFDSLGVTLDVLERQ